MTQFVTIDRAKRLKEQPETGHNRWHPDIPPIVEVEQHENIVIETRDASDGQVTHETTASDFEAMDQNVSHPLTGPVYVKGRSLGTCSKWSTWRSFRSTTAGRDSGREQGFSEIYSISPMWPTGT